MSTPVPGFPDPGSVFKKHLASDAQTVDPTQIPDGSITQAKLANSSVGSAQIIDGSVANAELGLLSVATGNLQDQSVTQAKIANGAVGGTQLANSAVGTANINNTAVTLAKLAASSVDNTKTVSPLKLVTPTPAQANLASAPTAADFNTLLANLKTAGVLT